MEDSGDADVLSAEALVDPVVVAALALCSFRGTSPPDEPAPSPAAAVDLTPAWGCHALRSERKIRDYTEAVASRRLLSNNKDVAEPNRRPSPMTPLEHRGGSGMSESCSEEMLGKRSDIGGVPGGLADPETKVVVAGKGELSDFRITDSKPIRRSPAKKKLMLPELEAMHQSLLEHRKFLLKELEEKRRSKEALVEKNREFKKLKVFLILAGSAGRGLPPHGPPFRLPADCEAGGEADFHDDDDDADDGGPSAARPKPPRGRALGKEILLRVVTTCSIPIPFDTNLNTRKALGRTDQLYYSGLGIQVRDNWDPSYREWVNVSQEQKDSPYRKLDDWFILNFADPLVSQTVSRDVGLRYKDWKNTLHAHFKKYGGRNNPSLARSRIPKSIRDPAYWDRCIERFCSEAFQRYSTSTTKSRALNTDGGHHGQISMLEHMERTPDPVTQQSRPIIEN